jgi:hypothetical protein
MIHTGRSSSWKTSSIACGSKAVMIGDSAPWPSRPAIGFSLSGARGGAILAAALVPTAN